MPTVPFTSGHLTRSFAAVQAWAWLALLCVMALVLYVGQFEDTNAYVGIYPMQALSEVAYWLVLFAWLAMVASLFPMQVRYPSDVFLALYLIGTCLWSGAYWPATRLMSLPQSLLLALLLLLPAVLVKAAQLLVRTVPLRLPDLPLALSQSQLTSVLGAFLMLAAVLGYGAAGADGGFDFEEAVVRRLAGRDSFAGQTVAAYMVQMSMNGVAPLLAYLGALRRSWAPVLLALAFAVFGFWLVATKAPLLFVILLATLGYLVRTGRVVHFARWLVLTLAVAMGVAILELWIFDLSLIAEFVIRRMILVSSTIQVYFFDALARDGLLTLLFNGLSIADYASPEYFIGDNYMGSEATNANTNAYLHQIANSGVFSYFAVAFGTALLTGAFDLRFDNGRHADGFGLAALLGFLLVEQAFTTALVSSGVLLCLLLCMVFSRVAPLSDDSIPHTLPDPIS